MKREIFGSSNIFPFLEFFRLNHKKKKKKNQKRPKSDLLFLSLRECSFQRKKMIMNYEKRQPILVKLWLFSE